MSRLTEFPMEGCPEEFAAQIDPFPEGPDTEKAKAAPVGEMIPPPTPPKGPGTGERAAPVGEMLPPLTPAKGPGTGERLWTPRGVSGYWAITGLIIWELFTSPQSSKYTSHSTARATLRAHSTAPDVMTQRLHVRRRQFWRGRQRRRRRR